MPEYRIVWDGPYEDAKIKVASDEEVVRVVRTWLAQKPCQPLLRVRRIFRGHNVIYPKPSLRARPAPTLRI